MFPLGWEVLCVLFCPLDCSEAWGLEYCSTCCSTSCLDSLVNFSLPLRLAFSSRLHKMVKKDTICILESIYPFNICRWDKEIMKVIDVAYVPLRTYSPSIALIKVPFRLSSHCLQIFNKLLLILHLCSPLLDSFSFIFSVGGKGFKFLFQNHDMPFSKRMSFWVDLIFSAWTLICSSRHTSLYTAV